MVPNDTLPQENRMLITIENQSDIEAVWNKIGFYSIRAELLDRTFALRSWLTIEETEEVLKDFDVKIRKLPESYVFRSDR
jgi:hypothetical protein